MAELLEGRGRLASCVLVAMATACIGTSTVAQTIRDTQRPRIAYAADGSFAIAYEALVGTGGAAAWHAAVQRYTAGGVPVGPLNLFAGESCQVTLDIWLGDFQHNLDLAFRSDGILLVLMQHSGELQFAGDGRASAEATIGAVDANGQIIDLTANEGCVQQKLIFVGGSRQDRPRMALMPNDEVVIIVDGFFQGSDLRNVAVRVLDNQLAEVIEEVIPHDDPASQSSFHMFPDVATNGSLILTSWQECPIVDNQGNADQCDIGIQFAQVQGNGLVAVGGNRKVNSDPSNASMNIWPAAAMDAAGNSVLVWADTRDGNAGEIYGQRFDNQGNPVGPNFRVSTGQGEIYTRPEIAMRSDGSFMVVWEDSSSAGFAARGRRFSSQGSPEGGPSLLSGLSNVQTGFPHVATSGPNFFYTWSGTRGGPLQVFSNSPAVTDVDSDAPVSAFAVTAYPSPFTDHLRIRFSADEPTGVIGELFDLLGRRLLVEELQVAAGERTLDLNASGLAPGAYLLRLRVGDRSHTQTVIRAE